jgi:GDP-L-fucose synthase
MEKNSRIYIAGHTGLVGSALTRCLKNKGYDNLIFRTLEELDLTDQRAVDIFFEEQKPEYVFLAAAVVGGIVANNTYRADFIYFNIMIQSNVIHASYKNKVKKLLFLGSTCIYPKEAQQPLKEDYLLTLPLEYTNEPYAIAKIAGLKMCESFNIQYSTNFIAIMPTNLYGPADNFNLEKSHVLPALLRKIHLGKCLEDNNWDALTKDLDRNPIENLNGSSDKDLILKILDKYGVSIIEGKQVHPLGEDGPINNVSIKIWGTGTPLREFMYSSDMAEACIYVMENVDVSDIIKLNQVNDNPEYHPPHFINIGTGEEISIYGLALKIKELIGFRGAIEFDSTKPDGTMRKVTDVSSLRRLGFMHNYNLSNGLIDAYDNYLKKNN